MTPSKVHFVGIGGVGMSALAQLYRSKGVRVQGSDRAASPVTKLLTEQGITVFEGHDATHVPADTELLVFSDAVPTDNPERVRAQELGIKEQSYFEALGEATREGTSIVVSGTHGKTSTTAMIAEVLIETGQRPTVIAGSILAQQGSNFIEGDPNLFVIEGCEYKRHFLHLHPDILVLTNIELDHTDYYHSLEDIQDAFREVIAKVPENGTIITDTSSPTILPVLDHTSARVVPYQEVHIPKLLAPGRFNTLNAQAAKAAVLAYNPDLNEGNIEESLQAFRGTWRRFEYKGVTKSGAQLYDDYAHHPTAIEGTLQMVKQEFPDKRIVVVFHPHLYSRTKSFFDGFVRSLALADEVILLPIYAAREQPDSSVSSEQLVAAIQEKGTTAQYVEDFDGAAKLLQGKKDDTLLLTMGAGDVYQLARQLL